MKIEEAYTELSVQLARIEAKVDKILSVFVGTKDADSNLSIPPDIIYTSDVTRAKGEALDRLVKIYGIDKQKCIFDSIPLEDRNKPMGICCPCSKCRATSLASAFNDGLSLEDAFNNPNAPKSILDAVDNPPPILNAHITETI